LPSYRVRHSDDDTLACATLVSRGRGIIRRAPQRGRGTDHATSPVRLHRQYFSLLDVHEVIANADSNTMAREAYIHLTIDRILQLAPKLASRLIGSKASEGLDEMPADTRRA
jgi:DNA segregation ATPase FtsK/SpoIIIE-like protein